MSARRPVMLLILDGFGIAPAGPGNAIEAAKMPNIRKLRSEWPHAELQASGRAVGLPEGQMGNSEVGHTNIGAGRVVWQELSRISNAVDDGSFFKNEELVKAMDNAYGRCMDVVYTVDGCIWAAVSIVSTVALITPSVSLMALIYFPSPPTS